MVALCHEYPALQHGSRRLYGGDQTLSADKTIQSCGCGVIAALNLMVYLCRYHGCRADLLDPLVRTDPMPSAEYDRAALFLKQRYLPLIPRHGINGLLLAAGINRAFLRFNMPYRARWGVRRERFWSSIESMLARDLPVIFSIGPNFPLFWQHNKLPLYRRQGDAYQYAGKTFSHYVSVTGIDDERLRVSSWGREYYISRREYEEYVKAHSLRLVSNILWIEKK